MPLTYSVLIAEDETTHGQTLGLTLRRHESDNVKFRLSTDLPLSDPGRIVVRASGKDAPDILVLDNYLATLDGPAPKALWVMCNVFRRCRENNIVPPLTVLHTAGIDPLLAYSFLCAGGHHVIDKRLMPDLEDRVKLIRKVIDGCRWRPEPHPRRVHLSPQERKIVPYLMEEPNSQAIADRVGTSKDTVESAISRIQNSLGISRASNQLSRTQIVKELINAGHAFVPIPWRRDPFNGKTNEFEFDLTKATLPKGLRRLPRDVDAQG